MTIDYIKFSPTGNITILVTSPVSRPLQAPVAAKLLAQDCVGGEQVGYVESPAEPNAQVRLQMMGGEFCGNAAMSLGVLQCRNVLGRPFDTADVILEVSGSERPVPCRIRRESDESWTGMVCMPLPTAFRTMDLETDAGQLAIPAVEMPGITHLLFPFNAQPDQAQLRRRLPEWNRKIGAEALGALLWDEADSSIDPLIYVPSANTLVREHGCGSGSAAVGSWLAVCSGQSRKTDIHQPGGTITVDAILNADGSLSALYITGRIRILDEGSVFLDI